MSIFEVHVRSGQTTHNFGSTYNVQSVIFYDSIMLAPSVLRCPSYVYPHPGALPLSSSADSALLQTPTTSNWQRSQLTGRCLTFPISAYPSEMPTEFEMECPKGSYAPGQVARICRPCGITASDWFYVFEDSPAVLNLAEIEFLDGTFFYGRVELALQLVFDTHAPNSPDLSAVLSAQPGNRNFHNYCARTTKKQPRCASAEAESYADVWLGSGWGDRYKMRILHRTNWAILCIAGTTDCPSIPDPSKAGAFVCADPGELDESGSGMLRCVCKSGLCYTINQEYPAKSQLVNNQQGRSRLWFEVFDTTVPQTHADYVVQRGFLDLYLVADKASGMLHSYPSGRASKLNWFKFSPMSIDGSWSSADRTLTLSQV